MKRSQSILVFFSVLGLVPVIHGGSLSTGLESLSEQTTGAKDKVDGAIGSVAVKADEGHEKLHDLAGDAKHKWEDAHEQGKEALGKLPHELEEQEKRLHDLHGPHGIHGDLLSTGFGSLSERTSAAKDKVDEAIGFLVANADKGLEELRDLAGDARHQWEDAREQGKEAIGKLSLQLEQQGKRLYDLHGGALKDESHEEQPKHGSQKDGPHGEALKKGPLGEGPKDGPHKDVPKDGSHGPHGEGQKDGAHGAQTDGLQEEALKKGPLGEGLKDGAHEDASKDGPPSPAGKA